MSRKKFRYYLKADAATYYYVSGGSVLTTTTPTPIVKDPMSWREVDIQWQRNVKYGGIFRNFIIPVSFVGDAATILRHVFYTQEGIESRCILYIEQKKRKTTAGAGDETYVSYYSGDIDFSQKHDALNYFQAEVLDSGLAAIIKAKESTPQELIIDATQALKVYHSGLRLKNTTVVTLANEPLATNTWHQFMPMITIQSSESDVQVDVIEQPNQQALGTTAIINGFPFFEATIAGTVVIDYNLSILVGNSAGSSLGTMTYKMRITKWDGATPTIYDVLTEPNFVDYIGLNTAVGTVSIPMAVGDQLIFFAGLSPFNASSGSDAFLIDQTYNYSTLDIHYDLQLPDTVYHGHRYHTVGEMLIDKVTDGEYGYQSDYLSNSNLTTVDNKPYNTILTSGDALRRLGGWVTGFFAAFNFLGHTKIKTTLEEYHTDSSNRWMMGMGVEINSSGDQIVRHEHLSHFYDNSIVIADVGSVTDVQIEVALEYISNLLRVGTPNADYDGLNGKDEPNTTHVYDLPIIRKKAELDLVTPYRDDMYGIEFARANLLDKKTTDSKNDNDTFCVEVAGTPTNVTITGPNAFSGTAYPLARLQNVAGNSAAGLIAGDKAFNLGQTPKRKFFRNGARLHTTLHQQDAKTIVFKTTDKNDGLVSNLGSGTISEKANVPVSALDAPLFLPILFTFETKVPTDLPTLIANNPYGKIQFSYMGNTYQGFIDEVGIKPADNAVYTWKLLAAPDTDLTTLIH